MRYLTDCACINDNILYFFTYTNNALLSYNLETQVFDFLGSVPNKRIEEYGMYNRIYFYNNKLILTPFFSDRICVYDIKNKEFSFYDEEFHFDNSILVNGKVYGHIHDKTGENTLIEYDVEKNTVNKIIPFKTSGTAYFITDISFFKECLYFSYYNGNNIIEYNIKNKNIRKIRLPKGIKNIFSGMRYKEGFFIVDVEYKKAMLFDEKGTVLSEYILNYKKINNDIVFHRQIYKDGKVYLNFPYEKENIVIDIGNIDNKPKIISEYYEQVLMLDGITDVIVFPIFNLDYIHFIKNEEKKKIDNQKLFELMTKKFTTNNVITENEWMTLRTFLKCL